MLQCELTSIDTYLLVWSCQACLWPKNGHIWPFRAIWDCMVANIFFVPPVHNHNNIPHLHHQTNPVLSFDFCCLSSTQVMFENKDDLRIILQSIWLETAPTRWNLIRCINKLGGNFVQELARLTYLPKLCEFGRSVGNRLSHIFWWDQCPMSYIYQCCPMLHVLLNAGPFI